MTELGQPKSLFTLAPQKRQNAATSPPSGPTNFESFSDQDINQIDSDPKLVKTKPRSFFSSSDNRQSATVCLLVTVTACIILISREVPLYAPRMPPPHARPPRRHQKHSVPLVSPPSNRTTLFDPRQRINCETMMAKTQALSIQLVALDFDRTIVDVHTGGRWKGDAHTLVPHVRPSFQCLISHCIQQGIAVAVTTFSRQTNLIAQVLEFSMLDYGETTEPVQIPVFGGDNWVEDYTKGKQSQLYLALKHYNNKRHNEDADSNPLIITPHATMLIDDDPENIRVAVKDGYHAILYPAKQMG